jgi:hypothetical protein
MLCIDRAPGNKYHVEHFTCSECDVLFGPNDSYYEHGSKVCAYTRLTGSRICN